MRWQPFKKVTPPSSLSHRFSRQAEAHYVAQSLSRSTATPCSRKSRKSWSSRRRSRERCSTSVPFELRNCATGKLSVEGVTYVGCDYAPKSHLRAPTPCDTRSQRKSARKNTCSARGLTWCARWERGLREQRRVQPSRYNATSLV